MIILQKHGDMIKKTIFFFASPLYAACKKALSAILPSGIWGIGGFRRLSGKPGCIEAAARDAHRQPKEEEGFSDAELHFFEDNIRQNQHFFEDKNKKRQHFFEDKASFHAFLIYPKG